MCIENYIKKPIQNKFSKHMTLKCILELEVCLDCSRLALSAVQSTEPHCTSLSYTELFLKALNFTTLPRTLLCCNAVHYI